MKTPCRALVTALASALTVCCQLPAFADPPSWAPAHGERDRRHGDHDRDDFRYVRYGHPYWYQGRYVYRGYHGDDWHADYGVVRSGQCNTNVLLGATGAVTGAVIGNRSASPGNEGLATIFGTLAGGIIGARWAVRIDTAIAPAWASPLELVPVGHPGLLAQSAQPRVLAPRAGARHLDRVPGIRGVP